jgi:proteasome lid subunit RPN8/RPN11
MRREMVEHAHRDRPLECCGLLVGRGREVTRVVPMRNIDASPTRFTIEPHEHISLMRELRQLRQGEQIVGVYHSHPEGPPRPSSTDIAEAHYPDWLYVVLGAACGRWRVRGFAISRGIVTPLRLCTPASRDVRQ